MLQITDEHEIHPEDRVMVLNWDSLGWYDPPDSILVDGSAPRQVTDMLVVLKTPARVLEIAGKAHQTPLQTTMLIVIEVCALQLRPPHMLGSSSELWSRCATLKRFLTVIL